MQAAVQNVEEYLAKSGKKLNGKVQTPTQTTYRPEFDVSAELNSSEAAYYQSLIGIL